MRALIVAVALLPLLPLACTRTDDAAPMDAGIAESGDAAVAPEHDPIDPADAAFIPSDINHILSTGQSLGTMGSPPLSTTQPFENLMFESGTMAGELDDAGANVLEGGLAGFVPLVEGDSVPNAPLPVETMSSGFANLVSTFRPDHRSLVSVHGAGATSYRGLARGSAPYALGMAQVTAARDQAKALGKTYVVRAVTTVHGESDQTEGNTHYADDLITWQADYEHDVRALTGQREAIPLFESQMSTIAPSAIPQAQLDAHVRAPGKVILVGPKYHLPYADSLHLTNEGYRHMGEDYARAYRRVVLEGGTWEPVRPTKITRAGDTIRIVFAVPSPPLAFDTTHVAATPSQGFVFTDGTASSPAIAEVALEGANGVRIRLAAAPSAPGRLRYGVAVPRGNLRDSDATPSRNGYALYNWCVQFDAAVE